jgi:gluconate 2-dehydrogenase subunit 3-like protein
VKRRTGTTPGGRQPRFPGFDVLAQADHWDPATREVVLARLEPPAPLRFFTPPEAETLGAVLDCLLDQEAEPKVPVLSMIDERLAAGRLSGWHYKELPDDAQTLRELARGVEQTAEAYYERPFSQLGAREVQHVLEAIRTASAPGEVWERLPAKRCWNVLTRYACEAFYAHPWAWNEIGFGGPAYPRGYARLGLDMQEWWEVRDVVRADPVRPAEQLELEDERV